MQTHSAIFIVVTDLLRQAGRHSRFKADCVNAILTIKLSRVNARTIYATITPRRAVSCARPDRCLRQNHDGQHQTQPGPEKIGAAAYPDMVSIRAPAWGRDRLVPGHWEADLIKGASNRSAVARWSSAPAGW